MTEERLTYRVRPGFRHGKNDEYEAGATVQLTRREAEPLLDKLQLVKDAEPVVDQFDPSDFTLDELDTWLETLPDDVEVQDVLDAEQQGKQRKGAIEVLTDYLADED